MYQFLHHKEILPVGRNPLVEVTLLLCSPAVGACGFIHVRMRKRFKMKKKGRGRHTGQLQVGKGE